MGPVAVNGHVAARKHYRVSWPGEDPAIHDLLEGVDARHRAGHDGKSAAARLDTCGHFCEKAPLDGAPR